MDKLDTIRTEKYMVEIEGSKFFVTRELKINHRGQDDEVVKVVFCVTNYWDGSQVTNEAEVRDEVKRWGKRLAAIDAVRAELNK